MRMRYLVPTVLMLMSAAFAQKAEVYGNYSYMQFNPTITGLQSRALNGGGGGVQFNLGPKSMLGFRADLQGYQSTQWSLDVKSPISTPGGIIPIGNYKSDANMFTYMFGPVINFNAKKLRVFTDVLFGQTVSNGYVQLTNAVIAGGGKINKAGDQHPFTMAFGGGLDLNVSKTLSFRLGQMDYVLTRFSNPFTGDSNQNNFRYQAGIIFKFGAK